eukprot:gene10715-12464_t
MSSSQSAKIMSTIAQFVDKVKTKSHVIEDNMPDTQKHINFNKYDSEIKLLDPLNTLGNVPSSAIYDLIDADLNTMTDSIIDSVTNGISGSSEHGGGAPKRTHPVLTSVAKYYFELKGKRIRPTIVLLLSRALLKTNNVSPSLNNNTSDLLPTQLRLAEIIEMIHTASLVHDDVIDEADTRRDVPSINFRFNNKLAVLCGDFLLARKTYLKTASLICNGCRATAVLSGVERDIVDISTDFGKHLGLAFQIVDDLLDLTASSEDLGKPASVDLKLGLATAPVLFAQMEFPELEVLINRKFSEPGDIEEARRLVFASKATTIGIKRSVDHSHSYRCDKIEIDIVHNNKKKQKH